MKKALVLGAGLVSRPLVKYLLDQKDVEVTVATRTVSKAQRMIEGHERGRAVQWTVDRMDELDKMVEEHDVVVSLLPYTYHVQVADVCIKHKKPLVTTSYVSEEMRRRDEKAKDAGVLLLNEIGLDPGIDHMSAKKTINLIRSKNGKVKSFRSLCGAIPSPEANDNPIKYKFSWSPRGVLLAARNDARFLKDGKIVEVPGEELFDHCFTIEFEGVGTLEVYPNRDSVPYVELYDIKETDTMFRGTLRYPGWCELMGSLRKIGYLELEERDFRGLTYRDFILSLVGGDGDPKEAVANFLGISIDSEVIRKFEWLGLFEDDPIERETSTPLDVLLDRMLPRMQYKEDERDMVVLYDEFIAEYPDGRRERIISSLQDFGVPGGDTAVARTVALPAAVAVKLILDGRIKLTGVWIPVHPEIYEPVMEGLKELGMEIKETVTSL